MGVTKNRISHPFFHCVAKRATPWCNDSAPRATIATKVGTANHEPESEASSRLRLGLSRRSDDWEARRVALVLHRLRRARPARPAARRLPPLDRTPKAGPSEAPEPCGTSALHKRLRNSANWKRHQVPSAILGPSIQHVWSASRYPSSKNTPSATRSFASPSAFRQVKSSVRTRSMKHPWRPATRPMSSRRPCDILPRRNVNRNREAFQRLGAPVS